MEGAIAEYFAGIYRRPDHMQLNSEESVLAEDTEMIDEVIAAVEESIDTTAMFSLEDI